MHLSAAIILHSISSPKNNQSHLLRCTSDHGSLLSTRYFCHIFIKAKDLIWLLTTTPTCLSPPSALITLPFITIFLPPPQGLKTQSSTCEKCAAIRHFFFIVSSSATIQCFSVIATRFHCATIITNLYTFNSFFSILSSN